MARSRKQPADVARQHRAAMVGAWCAAVSMLLQADDSNGASLLLNIGFETETVVSSGESTHDYLQVALPSVQNGVLGIQYEGGTPDDRYARVIDDSTRSGNKVLEFAIKAATIPGQRAGRYKGRVQLNLVNINKTFLYQRVRMYLHPDLAIYRSYPKQNTWFTINELWAGAPWEGHDRPFRISLNIVKEKAAGSPLRFAATGSVNIGEDRWEPVWSSVNRQFSVPVGQWLDMEIGYKQGNRESGRFYVAVKPASTGVRTEVLNVTHWTYHPLAPQPVPLTHWQPLKVYTSSDIIDYVRDHGGVVRIHWDDLKIWDGWPG